MINRFYLGAAHIANAVRNGLNPQNCKPSLDAAIAEAKAKVENGSDCEIIVQIVAIVRPARQPIDVVILNQNEY